MTAYRTVAMKYLMICVLLFTGCAKRPIQAARPTPPAPSPSSARAVLPGDMILKHAEIKSDSVVCHRPIQMIDARKKREDVIVYLCR